MSEANEIKEKRERNKNRGLIPGFLFFLFQFSCFNIRISFFKELLK